ADEIQDRIRGLTTGASEYVGKPYDIDYLVRRASALCRPGGEPKRRAAPLVLVIEDSVTFRATLSESLEAAGYGVIAAASGEEGLRLVAQERPDAVIIDGQLPGISGAKVVGRIKLDTAA